MECPVLRPSEEEFAEPWRFLASVRPLLEQYGLVRVIPPPTWKPRFVLDTRSLRVTVEPQRVYQLLEQNGARMKFIAELREFLEARGTPLTRIPVVGGRDLDLQKLFRTVKALGGHHRVVAGRRWPEVVAALGLSTAHSSYMLRQHYAKILLAYEQHLDQQSRSAGAPPTAHPPPALAAAEQGAASSPLPLCPISLPPLPGAAEAPAGDTQAGAEGMAAELARLRAVEPPRSISREVLQQRLLAAEAQLRNVCGAEAAGGGMVGGARSDGGPAWSEWLEVR